MDKIDSTRLRAVLEYDPDTGGFTWTKGNKPAGYLHSSGYVLIRIDGVSYRAHRLAWLYVHGVWPEDQIDHINRTRADNRISNLREATPQGNAANRGARAGSKSGYPGVTWYARYNKWQACRRHGGKIKHLGYFDCPDAAHAAYLAAN